MSYCGSYLCRSSASEAGLRGGWRRESPEWHRDVASADGRLAGDAVDPWDVGHGVHQGQIPGVESVEPRTPEASGVTMSWKPCPSAAGRDRERNATDAERAVDTTVSAKPSRSASRRSAIAPPRRCGPGPGVRQRDARQRGDVLFRGKRRRRESVTGDTVVKGRARRSRAARSAGSLRSAPFSSSVPIRRPWPELSRHIRVRDVDHRRRPDATVFGYRRHRAEGASVRRRATGPLQGSGAIAV